MHDHDPDLIMALAEGATDLPEAVGAAIGSCDACAADLAAQQLAIAALRTAPRAGLTELESARLLRNLDTALGHQRAMATTPIAPERRRISWAPAFGIAAVVLALVLVVPALDLLGGGDDAGDFQGALSTATTAAAAAEERSTADVAAAPEAAGGDFSAAATTVPAADGGSSLTNAESADAALPLTLVRLRSLIAAEGDDPDKTRDSVAAVASLTQATTTDACLTEGRLVAGSATLSYTLGVLPIVTTGDDEAGDPQLVTVTVHQLASGELWLVAHEPQTCDTLATLP